MTHKANVSTYQSIVHSNIYISTSTWKELANTIKTVECKTNTKIDFNFRDQYFYVAGNEQEHCINAKNKLINKLLPHLESHFQSEVPTQNVTTNGKYADPELKKIFSVAPYVKNIKHMLDTNAVHPKQPQSYLEVISEETDTYCKLIEEKREIEITGREESSVNEAYSRLDVIQTNFITLQKVYSVYCFHYPNYFDSYRLSFCGLESAKNFNFITQNYDLTNQLDELFAMEANACGDGRKEMLLAKEFNLKHMKMGFEKGLTCVNGFCGDIRLTAKLGKLFWKGVTNKTLSRLWKYQDIKTAVIRQLGTRPYFTSYSTKNLLTVERILKRLPSSSSNSSCYEFHGEFRTSNRRPYKPMIIYACGENVKVQKVTTQSHNVCQVNWSSFERAFDFQINLKIQELKKITNKPFNEFSTKIAYSPRIRAISFQNIHDQLYIQHVLYKQTQHIKLDKFILEVTRTELAEMGKDSTNRMLAQFIDQPQVWYDLELVNPAHEVIFKSNMSLGIGHRADWKPDLIIGEDATFVIEMMKTLLQLNEVVTETVY